MQRLHEPFSSVPLIPATKVGGTALLVQLARKCAKASLSLQLSTNADSISDAVNLLRVIIRLISNEDSTSLYTDQ